MSQEDARGTKHVPEVKRYIRIIEERE